MSPSRRSHVLAGHPDRAQSAVRLALETDPLVALPDKALKLPPFWAPEAFPAPRLRGSDVPLPPDALAKIKDQGNQITSMLSSSS